jgi:MscS family membrane protein
MDDFLTLIFLGNPLRQWLIALLFILGGLAAGKIVSLVVAGIARRLRKNEKRPLAAPLMWSLLKPLLLFFFLCGIALGLAGLRVHETARLWIDRVLRALFIVLIAWGAGRFIDRLILYLGAGDTPADEGKEFQPLIRRFFKALLWIIGAALILRTMGYNISALWAGLGLGGAALALASKDTLSNFFGSITVFVDHPFRINDRIKIGDYDGTIIEMGIRSSKLRTLENRIVSIPNSIFASTPIENISAAPNAKISQTIRFRGDNGSEKIVLGISILREIGASTEGLEGSSIVGLASPGGLVCPVTFIYFVSKKAAYMDTINQVNLEVLRRFEEAGIRLV